MTTLLETLNAAIEAAATADSAWTDCEHEMLERCEHRLAADAADKAVEAAREALRASDEPRPFTFKAEGAEETITATSLADARTQAVEWAREGDYIDEGQETIWVDVRVDGADGSHDTVTVAIDPEEPECSDENGHEWAAPVDIVGGCKESPGVYGHAGGVTISEVCVHCGCRKLIDTWAQRRDTGEEGLKSLRYDPKHYDVSGLVQAEAV
jgi:hypothetical protein